MNNREPLYDSTTKVGIGVIAGLIIGWIAVGLLSEYHQTHKPKEVKSSYETKGCASARQYLNDIGYRGHFDCNTLIYL